MSESQYNRINRTRLIDLPTLPAGQCNKHRANVFATELCASFLKEPGIEVVEVENRPTAKEPRQESLI